MVLLSSVVILTRMQVRHWQNSITLFEHTLKVTENNTIAENNYGCALLNTGRLDEAVLHLSNAIRINPANVAAQINLGEIFVKQGKLNEAVACFNELLKQNEYSTEVHNSLATALVMQKKYEEAIEHLAKTLELDPEYPAAHHKMGIALATSGRIDEAIVHFNEALRINPDQAEVRVNLGIAYTQLGKYELAIQNWTRVVELEPNSANAVNALNNLAWLLATTGDASIQDANKAVGCAQRACELTEYKAPTSLDTLAAAYAAAGRFDDALKTARQAVNIAKVRGQEKLVSEIQSRIELYQTGRSYIRK
ncbi:Beta-barrel assembly-enhancing protease [subsurface metagenome]